MHSLCSGQGTIFMVYMMLAECVGSFWKRWHVSNCHHLCQTKPDHCLVVGCRHTYCCVQLWLTISLDTHMKAPWGSSLLAPNICWESVRGGFIGLRRGLALSPPTSASLPFGLCIALFILHYQESSTSPAITNSKSDALCLCFITGYPILASHYLAANTFSAMTFASRTDSCAVIESIRINIYTYANSHTHMSTHEYTYCT